MKARIFAEDNRKWWTLAAVAFGLFIGIGRYRPQNGGYLGRFTVKSCKIQ